MDMRLVTKGRGEPRAGLVEQGKVQRKLAQDYAAALDDAGWSAEDTAKLAAAIAALETDAAKHVEDQHGAHQATAVEHAAIDEAKRFTRILRHALPRALRSAPPGVTAASFHAGEPLARSTPKISRYLDDIRPAVVKLDDALAPAFKKAFAGKKPSEALDQVKGALDTADATQETALAALPAQTLGVYEAKGRLLEAIEDVNRAGLIAFDGDAAAMAPFNKDVLLRARRARAQAHAAPASKAPAAPEPA
jgi:hypothetical protein